MGMPSISITFTELAASAVKRGERGIIAMVLKESTVPENNPIVCASAVDVPKTLSEANQEQIKMALIGYVNAPSKVIVYVIAKEAEGEKADYTPAFDFLRTIKYNYLVIPTAETDGICQDVVSYVKTERTNSNLIKAVLPNTTADTEAVINYTTAKAVENDKEYTTEQYCARIAGIIAGTPLSISCTYAPLPELTDCSRLSKAEMDAAVDAGKFIIWWDGEKVKTARGVNSLTTLTSEKNSQFQKIKIVEAMDMIASDIRMTAEDTYLGKYANSYDNKCLLLSAIGNYFDGLQKDSVLSSYTLGIDVDANRAYLKGKGVDVDAMSDDEIKQANTGTYVFLTAKLSILDAIEDIVLPIAI